MNGLRAMTALALFGVFAACVTEPLRDPSPLASAEPPARSEASTATSMAPLGSALPATSAQATSDVPPPPPPAPTELPPREGAPGSTRGTIACGTARCDASTQVCVPNFQANVWACVAKDAPRDSYLACDDGTDCPQGQTCCQGFASANTEVKCSTRSGPEADCASELCSPGGARCPAGQRCEGGYCRVEAAASCVVGKRNVRCGKDAPFCLWGAEPRCAARDEASALADALGSSDTTVRGVLSCTKKSDCGSMECCTGGALGPAMTYCANACDAANTMRVCDTNSDCLSLKPFYCAGDPSCQVVCARDLEVASSLPEVSPPWMKVCVRRDRR